MYTTILLATDLSNDHYEVCEKTMILAKSLKADVHLLHVIEPPTSLQLAQSLGFAEVVNPCKEDVVAVMRILGEAFSIPINQQHVEEGSIYQEVLASVQRLQCDLIVMGSHIYQGWPAFLGGTAHQVKEHIPCDVLTIHVRK